jgi:cardiolipin synthase A/B
MLAKHKSLTREEPMRTLSKLKKLVFNRIIIFSILLLIQFIWFGILLLRLSHHLWWINILLQLISFIALLIVINKEDNPAYKLAWAIPIIAFPIFGGLLYLLLGGKKPAKKMRRKMDESWRKVSQCLCQKEGVLKSIDQLDKVVRGQVEYIKNCSKYPVHGNTATKYYKSGEENFPEMLEALKNAKHYIFVEYYIIAEGTMWHQILTILKEKAMAGVDVRLIYDDFGCMNLLPLNYKDELAKYNIKCEVFNPVVPLIAAVMNHRDHRKIMVIDGYVGFTGGINLADEYINEIHRFGYWKDTGIRLKGEAVHNLTVMFLTTWNSLRKTDEDFSRFKPDYYFTGGFQQDGFVQPYADSPLDDENVAENVYLNIINTAVNYVYLFTPYLIIDNEMMTALCLAAKRGVDVRIVTPNIPDKKIIFYVTQSYYHQLVDAGIKIYQFAPGFLHAKCYVSDDKIATIGTINMDYRSLYLHFECGVYLYGTSAVATIKEDFCDTMKESILINEKLMRHRLPMRLFQSVLRLFAPML